MNKTEAKFHAKLIADGDCQLWQGAKQTGGFGQIWADGRNMLAHRYSYELVYGPLPEGSFLVHDCGAKTCVNPSHLRVTDRSRSANVQEKVEELFWGRVEKTESCWNWIGSKSPLGYGAMRKDAKTVKAHRFSYELLVGPIPTGMYIDHLCHNPSCVRPEHLRPVTPRQNSENRRQASTNSNTGVRGVAYDGKKYVARVYSGGKQFFVGRFSTLEEAKGAVIAKRNELHTHNDADRQEAA